MNGGKGMDITERKTWATKVHQVGSILSLVLGILTWVTLILFFIYSLFTRSEIHWEEHEIMSPSILRRLLGMIVSFWIAVVGTIVGVFTLIAGAKIHANSRKNHIGILLSSFFLLFPLMLYLYHLISRITR